MERRGVCAMGVMAKAPQPGKAKTRLCPPLLPEQAARLSAAFLRDITENIVAASRQVPIDGCIAYAPMGTEAWFDGHLADGTGFVLADGSPMMPENLMHGIWTLPAACGAGDAGLRVWGGLRGEFGQSDVADVCAGGGGARVARRR